MAYFWVEPLFFLVYYIRQEQQNKRLKIWADAS